MRVGRGGIVAHLSAFRHSESDCQGLVQPTPFGRCACRRLLCEALCDVDGEVEPLQRRAALRHNAMNATTSDLLAMESTRMARSSTVVDAAEEQPDRPARGRRSVPWAELATAAGVDVAVNISPCRRTSMAEELCLDLPIGLHLCAAPDLARRPSRVSGLWFRVKTPALNPGVKTRAAPDLAR